MGILHYLLLCHVSLCGCDSSEWQLHSSQMLTFGWVSKIVEIIISHMLGFRLGNVGLFDLDSKDLGFLELNYSGKL